MYPAGVPGITVRYVAIANDVSIRVIEAGPARDDAVLLVHGWAGCVYTFSEMIPALAAAGHRIVAFDLTGHGLSDKPTDDSRYTTRALSESVLAVADALGIRRFTFVGHSMGGSLGLDLATRGERRINALVLINSVGLGRIPMLTPVRLVSPPIINRWMPTLLTRPVATGILHLAYGTPSRPTSRDIDEYWAPTQFDEFLWACRACLHKVNWNRTPATKLRSLRIPVLVIIGGRDHLVRATTSRAGLIPTARVVKVREGGHLVLQECSPKTNAEILLFLKGVPSRP
jgi:pimeloyl-ACP methyl ester carboxylesterase